ncbi:centromere kinetochore component CENP-T-domain-containing protein [Tirmania nivea]|nr:centromere kinetochore component CENP-T-domain-containing protein [Tirmania nivea]
MPGSPDRKTRDPAGALVPTSNPPATPKTPAPIPITPHRRGAPRPPPSTRRTPSKPTTLDPPVPLGSRPPLKSPHVIRAWETKRALTPGRERRKSARWHLHATHARDSPIDILKQLSFNLAPKSRPFYLDATPKPTPRTSLLKTPGSSRRESVVFTYHSDPEGLDDEEDGNGDGSPPTPPHPRLSLDPEDETFTGRLFPRLSATARRSTAAEDSTLNDSTLDDSVSSIELPRRAPPDSYLNNRMSFGFHISDNFADLDELGVGNESPLHHMGGGGGSFMHGVDDHNDVAAGGDESTENIWEGLDMGDSTRDLNRRLWLVEDAATEEVGPGLDEDSLGVFQLLVPELVGGEDGEGNEDRMRSGDGRDGEGSSDEEMDRMDVDSEGKGDEQEGVYDEDEGEHEVRLGEVQLGSPSQPRPFHDLDDGFSTQAGPSLRPHSASDSDAEHTSTFPSSKTKQPDPTKPLRKTKSPSTKPLKLSRHNLPIPSLPPRLIKKLATNFAGSAGKGISNETLAQIVKASDIFFENACVRVGEYAEHAGRKTVGERDVELLMKRQRILNPQNTVFSLAEKYLPRELLQEIRMPVQGGAAVKKRKRTAATAGGGTGKVKGKGKARARDDGVEEKEEIK